MSSSDLMPDKSASPTAEQNPILTVAGVQMTSGGTVEDSLADAAQGIEQAVAQQARLVVLPENFGTLGTGAFDTVAQQEAAGDAGSISDWASQQAREHGIYLVAGTVPIHDEKTGKSLAASRVFGPDGRQIARYDKIHLFDVDVGDAYGSYRESDHYAPGSSVVTWDIPADDGEPLRVGLTVCYDLRFPELYDALRQQGAELILVPSAFTHSTGQAHWGLLLRARAVEQGCYVLGVNQCGWHDSKRRTWGHSQLIDPWGDARAALASEPDVLIGRISRDYLKRIRTQLPTHQHHRL
ncbi:MAG: carbon-nitrogen hydrolase family protein [Natronospirillum sp.]|uniref:carbon-nitrogen hydrolase family protein n=1 Tax=Natronospirillum sp. TaxID=2812955 RepID=UPI0025DC5B84|nr:carbon-nitrogen hydrolase family protein [Natronospirillum sp.]MCH8550885.1 carbon-nitrogen hydrolase family protein [Natronospirillum sp.]